MAYLMKKCISCGAELPSYTHFCGICGATQPEPVEDYNDKTIIRSQPSHQPQSPMMPPSSPFPNQPAPSSPPYPPANVPPGYGPSQSRPPFSGAPKLYLTPLSAQPMPPVVPVNVAQPAPKRRSVTLAQWVTILIVLLVIVAGVGLAWEAHLFGHPQPVITLTSSYQSQNIPVGAAGTTFHISALQFASGSSITFLLDQSVLKNTPPLQSDGDGNFTIDLPITADWQLGPHQLTARDADGNLTSKGVIVRIVAPGVAGTPGINGAPTDSASFTLHLTVRARQDSDHTELTYTYTLIITGHPDPLGGSVCAAGDDKHPIFTQNTDPNGVTYKRTSVYACSGTYKGGVLSYLEILQSEQIVGSDGSTCQLKSSQPNLQITGSYNAQHIFSGQATYVTTSAAGYTCDQPNSTYQETGNQGTWTATIAKS